MSGTARRRGRNVVAVAAAPPPTSRNRGWRLVAMPGIGRGRTLDVQVSNSPKGRWMREISTWATRCGNALRTAAVAVDPGEDGELDEQGMLDSLDDELRRDFAAAAMAFAWARRRRQAKDTPVHRRGVLQCAAQVNLVLDMYLMHLEIRRDLAPATIA